MDFHTSFHTSVSDSKVDNANLADSGQYMSENQALSPNVEFPLTMINSEFHSMDIKLSDSGIINAESSNYAHSEQLVDEN